MQLEVFVYLGHIHQVVQTELEPKDLMHFRVLKANNTLILTGRNLSYINIYLYTCQFLCMNDVEETIRRFAIKHVPFPYQDRV